MSQSSEKSCFWDGPTGVFVSMFRLIILTAIVHFQEVSQRWEIYTNTLLVRFLGYIAGKRQVAFPRAECRTV